MGKLSPQSLQQRSEYRFSEQTHYAHYTRCAHYACIGKAAGHTPGNYAPPNKAEQFEFAVRWDERQLLVCFKALVPHTWVEGTVVELVRVVERQRAVRHAGEPAVAVYCAVYVARDRKSVAATTYRQLKRSGWASAHDNEQLCQLCGDARRSPVHRAIDLLYDIKEQLVIGVLDPSFAPRHI